MMWWWHGDTSARSKDEKQKQKRALDARAFSQREKRYQVEAVALRQSGRVQRPSACSSEQAGFESHQLFRLQNDEIVAAIFGVGFFGFAEFHRFVFAIAQGCNAA